MPGGGYRPYETTAGGYGYAPQTSGDGADWLGRAAHLVNRIVSEVGMGLTGALALVGGLAHESGGLIPNINQGGRCGDPSMGKGGYGYAQWTGVRKKAYVGWCHENGLSPQSVEANEGFVIHELKNLYHGAVGALSGVNDLAQAVRIAEQAFEQAGAKAYGSRLNFAEKIAQHMHGAGADFTPASYTQDQHSMESPTGAMPSEGPPHARRRHDRQHHWHSRESHGSQGENYSGHRGHKWHRHFRREM